MKSVAHAAFEKALSARNQEPGAIERAAPLANDPSIIDKVFAEGREVRLESWREPVENASRFSNQETQERLLNLMAKRKNIFLALSFVFAEKAGNIEVLRKVIKEAEMPPEQLQLLIASLIEMDPLSDNVRGSRTQLFLEAIQNEKDLLNQPLACGRTLYKEAALRGRKEMLEIFSNFGMKVDLPSDTEKAEYEKELLTHSLRCTI